VTEPPIPYGRQIVTEEDIAAVVDVLRGDWLTGGPAVASFEKAFAEFVAAPHAVAVSSGTAALHLAMIAVGVGPGDEVIVPALTFAASANAARFVGATVVFADVDPETLTIDPAHVATLVTDRTAAIVAVDYAGLPCDLDALAKLARERGIALIEDACHAPGATYRGAAETATPVGAIADATAFSFHPVKHITTGEGGMVTTASAEIADRVRALRSHGIASDFRSREATGTWEYDQTELGYNYRITDFACALGHSQLARQTQWLERRREIAQAYQAALAGVEGLRTQAQPDDRTSAWHLFVVGIEGADAARVRAGVFGRMRADGIGVNVHYRPVYLHSYYAQLGYPPGLCPVTEQAYAGLLTLPLWPGLQDDQFDRVVASLTRAIDLERGRS